MTQAFVVRRAGEGEANDAFALPRVFKVTAEQSDGALAVWEEEVPPGAGPPLHVHHREQELFVVIDGRVRFRHEDEIVELGAGGVVLIPKGARHTFKNVGDGVARVMVTLTPGGGEGFFKEVMAAGLKAPDDMERIVEIGARYGLEFVGPPL